MYWRVVWARVIVDRLLKEPLIVWWVQNRLWTIYRDLLLRKSLHQIFTFFQYFAVVVVVGKREFERELFLSAIVVLYVLKASKTPRKLESTFLNDSYTIMFFRYKLSVFYTWSFDSDQDSHTRIMSNFDSLSVESRGTKVAIEVFGVIFVFYLLF